MYLTSHQGRITFNWVNFKTDRWQRSILDLDDDEKAWRLESRAPHNSYNVTLRVLGICALAQLQRDVGRPRPAHRVPQAIPTTISSILH